LQENSHTHETPAETKILQHNKNGAPRNLTWNYRSLIRMLTYLSDTTRSNIAYAVHQCTRFSTDPKFSHELALPTIFQQKTLDCYVDADFAGNRSPLTTADPSSVKSHRICNTLCKMSFILGF